MFKGMPWPVPVIQFHEHVQAVMLSLRICMNFVYVRAGTDSTCTNVQYKTQEGAKFEAKFLIL